MKIAHPLICTCLVLSSCDWDPASVTGGNGRYLDGYGSTGNKQRAPTDPGAAMPDEVSYWSGNGVKGAPLIKINTKQQKAFFYKGQELVGVATISTGKEGHDTPPGRYKVTEKDKDHRSSLYGVFKDEQTNQIVNDDVDTTKDKAPPGSYYVGAPMWNFLRFNGGVGMHTGYLPGYNASHGCVRLPDKMAEKFFDNAKVGTPVIVE